MSANAPAFAPYVMWKGNSVRASSSSPELINSCLARLSPIPHCQKCPCLMLGPFRISFSLRRPKSQGKIPKTRCTKGSCVESSQPPPSPLHQTLTWPDFASAQKGGGKGSLFHVDQRPFFERGGLAVGFSPPDPSSLPWCIERLLIGIRETRELVEQQKQSLPVSFIEHIWLRMKLKIAPLRCHSIYACPSSSFVRMSTLVIRDASVALRPSPAVKVAVRTPVLFRSVEEEEEEEDSTTHLFQRPCANAADSSERAKAGECRTAPQNSQDPAALLSGV